MLRPLVVGAPRTGFTLLISVVSNLLPLAPPQDDIRRRAIRAAVESLGDTVSTAICDAFAQRGITDDLIYNGNFQALLGGPKWLKPDDTSRACFRKYIGVRGLGDFTLITSHPRELLDSQEIVHSHSHPKLWLEMPEYAHHRKLASVRSPIGTLNSSCFSINALTSEYIQRFVPPEDDNDALRQHLALYKLTDLDFFAGLITPLKSYLEEFLECRDDYHVMRWEDLIENPAETIQNVADALDVAIDADYARAIWDRISHVNLTGAHKHNYRVGHAKVGGWRATLVNEHLALMREAGLEPICKALGYGAIPDLDPEEYTPWQSDVAGRLARGEVFRDYPDGDLFEFAFNKSNLDSTKFAFRFYEWREHTRVERASLTDEALLYHVWDAAEAAVGRLNAVLSDILEAPDQTPEAASDHARAALERHREAFSDPARLAAAGAAIGAAIQSPRRGPPQLLRTVGKFNVVAHGGIIYGLPQRLGPVDLETTSVAGRRGVIVGDSLKDVMARISPGRP